MDSETAQIVAYTYLFPVICVAGIIGNSLLLATLKLGNLRDSPYIYLATLAIADLVALFCVAGVCSVRCENCSGSSSAEYVGKIYEAYVYLPVSNMAALLVSFTTLTMTIERFIYVRHPMTANNIITRRKTKIIVCSLTLLSIGLNFPRFFLYDVINESKESTGPLFNENPNGTVTVAPPRFLTLNCVPPYTNYVLDKDMYCNISLPKGYLNQDDWLTSPDDQCIVNVAKLVNDDEQELIMMDSVFNYASEQRVVYNLTSDKQIRLLLTKFPCKKVTRFWGLGGVELIGQQRTGSKNATYVLESTHFYNILNERYFLFVSILYIAPYVAVAILNCYIITIVRKSATRRRSKLMARSFSIKSVGKMAEQDHLTMTLLCLTGIQLLANLVYTSSIRPLAKLTYGGNLNTNGNYQIHVVASNLFILVQYSSNFLFFAFFNGRFRREFRKVLLNKLSTKFKDAMLTSSTLRKKQQELSTISKPKPETRLSTSTVISICIDS